MADEEGRIRHRALNLALLKKYQNPYKILYLWSVQESLEVLAMLECIKMRDDLEEKRKKLMKRIKMTQEELNQMKPSTTGTVKELFSDDANESRNNSTRIDTDFEAQKDVIQFVQIHDMLSNFLVQHIMPRFKHERVDTYRKILNSFSKMERVNSNNMVKMWQNIMQFHRDKASETVLDQQQQQMWEKIKCEK